MRYLSNDPMQEFISEEEIKAAEQTGKFVETEIIVAHHDAVEAVEEKGHYETIAEYKETGGKDVRYVIDVEAVPYREAYDEKETVMIYTPYTDSDYAEMRARKIDEMSEKCNAAIIAGIDVALSDGVSHHFDMTTDDQINLSVLYSMAQAGMTAIPYHAKNEPCKYYSAADISTIYTQGMGHATFHQTYFNSLKQYITSLTTKPEIDAVVYGMPIPIEYQSEVLKNLYEKMG